MNTKIKLFFIKCKDKAKKLKKEIYALYLAYKSPKTSIFAKVLVVIIIAYAVSPIDFIPDFIPIIGYLDDLIILPLLIAFAIKLIPKDVMEECRKEALKDCSSKGGKKVLKKGGIIASLVIILLWIYIIYLIVKRVFFN